MMSRLYPRSIWLQPANTRQSAMIRTSNRQTPEFMARVIREKHRAKLARHGEDTQ